MNRHSIQVIVVGLVFIHSGVTRGDAEMVGVNGHVFVMHRCKAEKVDLGLVVVDTQDRTRVPFSGTVPCIDRGSNHQLVRGHDTRPRRWVGSSLSSLLLLCSFSMWTRILIFVASASARSGSDQTSQQHVGSQSAAATATAATAATASQSVKRTRAGFSVSEPLDKGFGIALARGSPSGFGPRFDLIGLESHAS
jgi:hypothetical protein